MIVGIWHEWEEFYEYGDEVKEVFDGAFLKSHKCTEALVGPYCRCPYCRDIKCPVCGSERVEVKKRSPIISNR